MRLLVGGRKCGKTTELLDAVVAHGEGAMIVVLAADEARFIWDQISSRNLPIAREQIVTLNQLRDGVLLGRRNPTAFIDNADYLLTSLVKAPIEVATMTVGASGRLRVIE